MNKEKSKSTNICIFRSEKNSIIEKSEKEEQEGDYKMKGCVSALFVVALYIVILVGCNFGILAAILTIVAFYGLFELLTRESSDQKDEKSAENPNFKISGSGSKDTMSPLDQSWDMHISSGIFGSDDFSGFSGFGKGKDGGE